MGRVTLVEVVSLKNISAGDIESVSSDGQDEGLDEAAGIDDQIVSLYLQRQDSNKGASRFRDYLLNNEAVRATRRRHIFNRAEPFEEGREKHHDYTQYKKRECTVCIPKQPGSDRCGCNRPLDHPTHVIFPLEDAGLTWSYSEHTTLDITDAFGRVKFSNIQKAKYIRLDAETNSRQLADLIQNVFNLHTPGVIISVKGSLLGFSVTSKIEKIIQRGLMKAAITTNGWITTSGIDAGYVISVGEALKAHNNTVPCIGFSSWGCLPEAVKEALTVKREGFSEKEGNTCSYPKIKIKPGSAVENLEANHSHHILSDSGAVGDWGSESYLRTSWEGYMRDELNIPVVMVVMQGSIGASQFLRQGLKSGTPAVVVYGSGGVCDVVVNLVRHSKEISTRGDRRALTRQATMRPFEVENVTTEICTCTDTLSMKCDVVNQFIDEANFEPVTRRNNYFLTSIYEIVTLYQDLLILFDVDDSHYDGLDAALLEALVKAQRIKEAKVEADDGGGQKSWNNLSGVQVALGWNRPDFAERLLKADTYPKDDVALGSILIHALAWNLHEFTELLISHDASIPMVAANAVVLYNTSHNCEHLKRYVRYNLGYNQTHVKFDKDIIDSMINKLVGSRNDFNSNLSNESDPYFELMLWAALSLYPEVAELMWKGTQEPIRAALFVVISLRRLFKSNKVIINTIEKDTLRKIRRRFEALAISILEHTNQVDYTVCERALASSWQRFNNKTYIDMAFKCKARDFIAHPACQEITERRWKRGLTSEVNLVTVFLITFCPLLLFTTLITFKTEYTADRNPIVRFFKKFKAYLSSPSVKFWLGVECYIAFLVYKTYIVLTELGIKQHPTSPKEIIYFVWFGMMLLDETTQAVSKRHFRDWANNLWNRIDALMYVFSVAGLVLVHIPGVDGQYHARCYNAGRIFMSMSLILFYLRLLHMFTIDSALGPTILMITKMLHDFKVVALMFVIVAIAFGVGYTVALTDPAQFPASRTSYTSGIFYYTGFQLFGELFVEDLTAENTTYFPYKTSSPARTNFVIGLVGVYMAIVVLMLVNILIAMFSDTYTRIKDREDVIFKFQRLELLLDVEDSFLPAPFSLFHFLLYYTVRCTRTRRKCGIYRNSGDNKWKDTVIRSAVVDSLEEYLKKERNLKGFETDNLVRQSTKLLKSQLHKLQRYVENVQSTLDSVGSGPVS